MRIVPDLILTDADIRTLNPAAPRARALAIAAGKILAVGADADILALAGPGTRVQRLSGRVVMPGLIDSHTHGLWGACRDLYEVFPGLGAPLADVLAGVSAKVATQAPGTWIIRGPWRPFERAALGPRPADLLDRITPDHPVCLRDVSQHNFWINSAAMRVIGLTDATPDVPGGEIDRGTDGHPTGILIEAATSLVQPWLEPTADQLNRAVLHMADYFHSLGITGFKEPMANAPELAALSQADHAGRLQLHTGAHLTRFSPFSGDFIPLETLDHLRATYQSPHLNTRFAKLFLDGVPIARTAAFCDPYPGFEHAPHNPDAMMLIAPDRLAQDLIDLDAAGYTVKMHAVGDRAIQLGLDAIEAARKSNGFSGLRHEIAHSNFIRPQDLPRFAALDAVAEVSPRLWYPGPVTPGQRAILGDARTDSCHPIRSLLQAGAEVIYGSDWPAAASDADPWMAMAGMISRADPTGQHPGTVGADQAISFDQALPIFTRNGARALQMQGQTGVLAAGASADMMVLAKDPGAVEPAELARLHPELVLFEGARVHGDY